MALSEASRRKQIPSSKEATALFSFKTECVAILSSLPILESDAKIIQIDPQGDKWERWAQDACIEMLPLPR